MTEKLPEAAQSYAEHGLSVIPVKKDKRPAISWKKYQQEIMDESMLQEAFADHTPECIGVVCGKVSGNLEVMDVDVKYDVTGKLAQSLLDLVAGVITDVDLPVIQTVNKGLHLYYRCNEIGGNKKLASNSQNEVLVETRGEGGYVVAPPTPGYTLFHGSILAIPEITPEQREKLFAIAASFDETETEEVCEPSFTIDASTGRSPFEDYNRRGDVVALLEKHGWAVVADKPDQLHLKRPGKTEDQTSASYHKEKRLFYVFTTSTVFEAGRAYNPVQVFAKLEGGDDFSEAARLLAADGFGDPGWSTTSNSSESTSSTSTPLLPIEGFPPLIQDFITTCADVYGTPRDYWAAGVLVSTALGIGDKIVLADKYEDVPIIWLCNIGDVSIGKTEPLSVCLKYFEKADNDSIKAYNLAIEEYQRAQKGEHSIAAERKPECFQYMVVDATPEAIAKVHAVNERGMMIYRDELKGWIDDFGRYSKTSGEQANMLSSFNRVAWTINRKSDEQIINIPKPTILVAGGMQPDLLPALAKGDRAESGFLARFAFTYPDNPQRPGYLDKTVPAELLQAYDNYLDSLVKLPEVQRISLTGDAKEGFISWYNRNDTLINETKDGYLKGVYGKLPIIFSRLIIIIHGMWLMCDEETHNEVSIDVVGAAANVADYFRLTGEKVHKRIHVGFNNKLPNKKLVAIYLKKELGLSISSIANTLNVHRQQIYRWLERWV